METQAPNNHGRRLLTGVLLTLVLLVAPTAAYHRVTFAATTYTNPIEASIPGGGKVTDCPDPSIIKSQTPGDNNWYIYCTSDPLSDADKDASGTYHFHLMAILKSPDLVNWTYVGDVFADDPSWLSSATALWAPDVHFFNGKYYLYYAAESTPSGGGSAIGVATSPSPAGPWTDSGGPVIEPGARATIDPMVVDDGGQKYIFYGSYYGGIKARTLSADGLHSDPASEKQVIIDNRYEATYLLKHGDFWYFFGSATNCCNGPLTGYSVFVGRSANILGPYVDEQGVSLSDPRVGGTPVISMNGNRWVGPGHNSVFTDAAGQDWFLYHAVDRNHPYFDGTTNTERSLLMDPLDWVNGWPSVRSGQWASDSPQPAPVAVQGNTEQYQAVPAKDDLPGAKIGKLSDEFNGKKLSKQWHWVRPPAKSKYSVSGGVFHFITEDADLYEATNTASVLTEPTPSGDYVVESRVYLDVPNNNACCYNFQQAGLVIYGNDDNFVKLVYVSIWNTRQTEWAKEITASPRYGNTVVGPPNTWTWLRIVKTTSGSEEQYRAYTSRDGKNWVRGGVWTAQLGAKAKIGLVGMGGITTSKFDYVRVYHLTQ